MQQRKALLIGMDTNREILENSMNELVELAHANDIITTDRIIQISNSSRLPKYFGKGKFEQVIDYFINNNDVNYLIINDELRAFQFRNIENELSELNVIVLDRTSLILEIFKNRAKTKEAKIQVLISTLRYEKAHLVRKNEDYDQQGGGDGLSNKGKGEKKIDLDREKINTQIYQLEKELKAIDLQKDISSRKRSKALIPLIALVGYTNAGKSSLLNRMIEGDIDKKVFEKDMLFATLDTNIRRVKLLNEKEIILSDTIGFIDKLPHHLIQAFKATLKEASVADLLIHVVDYSNDNYLNHINITNEILESIGVSLDNVIYILNKADLKEDYAGPSIKDNMIIGSVLNSDTIDLVKKHLTDTLFPSIKEYEVVISYQNYHIINELKKITKVAIIDNLEHGTLVNLKLEDKEYIRYRTYFI